MTGVNLNRPAVLMGLVVLSLAAGAASAAITLTDVQPNDIEAAQGTMNDSSSLTVTDLNVVYDGLTATNVEVTVSDDADDGTHNFDVSLELRDSTGGTSEFAATNGTTFSLDTASTQKVEFGGVDNHVTGFDTIDVSVEEDATTSHNP